MCLVLFQAVVPAFICSVQPDILDPLLQDCQALLLGGPCHQGEPQGVLKSRGVAARVTLVKYCKGESEILVPLYSERVTIKIKKMENYIYIFF